MELTQARPLNSVAHTGRRALVVTLLPCDPALAGRAGQEDPATAFLRPCVLEGHQASVPRPASVEQRAVPSIVEPLAAVEGEPAGRPDAVKQWSHRGALSRSRSSRR